MWGLQWAPAPIERTVTGSVRLPAAISAVAEGPLSGQHGPHSLAVPLAQCRAGSVGMDTAGRVLGHHGETELGLPVWVLLPRIVWDFVVPRARVGGAP